MHVLYECKAYLNELFNNLTTGEVCDDKMTEKQKMLSGNLYNGNDKALIALRDTAHQLTQTYNTIATHDRLAKGKITKELLGKTGNYLELLAPVFFDYGKHTYIGDNCFFNFNCTFLDCASITFKDNIFVGPNTSFFTACHPLLAEERVPYLDKNQELKTYEFAKPITVESDVWIGGNVIVNPGVTIGKGSVIGSGSVVTKDIPPNVIAAGNPCKIIREITKKDSVLE